MYAVKGGNEIPSKYSIAAGPFVVYLYAGTGGMLIDNSMDRNVNTAVFYRRIGSTTYKVCIHFSDTTQETISDKILRLIQREIPAGGYGTKDVPQTGQPPEGSSL